MSEPSPSGGCVHRYRLDVLPAQASGLSHFLPGSRLLAVQELGPDGIGEREEDTLCLLPEEVVFLAKSWDCAGLLLRADVAPSAPAREPFESRDVWGRPNRAIAGILGWAHIRCLRAAVETLLPCRHPWPPELHDADAANLWLAAGDSAVTELDRAKGECPAWLELTVPLLGQDRDLTRVAQLCDHVLRTLGPWTPVHFVRRAPLPAELVDRACEVGGVAGLRDVTGEGWGHLSCPACRSDLRAEEPGASLDGRLGICRRCGFPLPGVFAGAGVRRG